MINHYDNETRLTAILRCVVDDTADASMLQQLGPARTREEIFVSRALGKKPWAAIPPRTTLEMWLAFIAEDEAEPAAGSYTVRSCAESCIITYARRVKGATAIVPIFPPHSPYEIALAKLAGIIPVSYGVQGRPWELLINQLAGRGPRENVTVIYGSTPRHEDGQITPMQDLHGYDRPWPGGGGKNIFGGEKLADDMVSIVGDPSCFKGEDADGKFVQYSAKASTSGKILYASFDADTQYTFIIRAKQSGNTSTTNLIIKYTDNSQTYIDLPGSAAGTVYESATVSVRGKTIQHIQFVYSAGTVKLYYDQTGLFKGELSASQFSPYENRCPITPGLDMLRDNGDRLAVWSGEINTGAGEIISRSAEIASYAGEQLPGPWISSLDAYTPGATPTIGSQVVYELPDPAIYLLTQAELQRALGCTKYLGVGAWKLCPGVVTVITALLTTSEATTHYDLAPSEAEGWTFEISVDGQIVTGATGALSVAAGEHSVIITATPAVGAAACYIHPTLYSEEATP